MDVTISVAAAVLLLAANGFFVAAEFALVKMGDLPMRSLAGEGGAAARLALRIQGNIEAYLATCRLGITMASLGVGWVGESVTMSLLEPLSTAFGLPDAVLHTSAFVIGFVVFCALHLVLGQQVPKSLAILHPETTSVRVAYPLHLSHLALRAPNVLLDWISHGVLRLLGVEDGSQERKASREESSGRLNTFSGEDETHPDEFEKLRERFEQDQRPVSRIMVPRHRVHFLDVARDPDENLVMMCETAHARYPVVDGADEGRIVGILKWSDIFHVTVDNEQLASEDEPWRSLRRFCRKSPVVQETERICDLFESLRSEPFDMVLVVDAHSVLSGIVTLEDLTDEHERAR